MKAKFKGQVFKIDRGEAETNLHLKINGRVDTRLVAAQEAYLLTSITIKNIIGDTMKIGTPITIIISDEEPNEGLI